MGVRSFFLVGGLVALFIVTGVAQTPAPVVLVGAGPGSGLARELSALDGTEIASGFPFGADFTGGVRVAFGDVNGDGTPDPIVGSGLGGGHVRVVDGRAFSLLHTIAPFGESFTGGVYVAAGDVNGDGRADLIVGGGMGSGQVRVLSGTDLSPLADGFPFTPLYAGGVTVAAGDFNADGRTDVITGTAIGGAVRIFSGVGAAELASGFPYGPLFLGGVNVAAGDINGDGHLDVVTAPRTIGGQVLAFSGADISILASLAPYPGIGGVHVAVGDVNGDGRADIITGPGAGGAPRVKIFSGLDRRELHSFLAFDPAFTGGVFVAAPGGGTGTPGFTSAPNTTFRTGIANTFTVASTGGPGTVITASGALPTGVTFVNHGTGTATLAGNPPAGTGGTYALIFTASRDGVPFATQNFTLTVRQPPAITSSSVAEFIRGQAGSFTITTSGFPTPTLSTSGGLPDGLSFSSAGNGTATLSGTPTVNGTYPTMVTASNSAGESTTQELIIIVQDPPAPVPPGPPGPPGPASEIPAAFTSAASTTWTVGAANSFVVTTSGQPQVSTIEMTGALPNGVTFVNHGNGTATLAGTPEPGSAGVYPLDFSAFNGVGAPATQHFTLTVNNSGTPIFTSAPAATFTVGAPGTFAVTTSASPAVTSITQSGTLPAGVSFTNHMNGTATLEGTPASGSDGTYTLTFQASNGGAPVSQTFTLTVNPPSGGAPTITSANTATFVVSVPGSFTITTTGSPTSANITPSGPLPAGVIFTNNLDGTATLAGTPEPGSAGSYPLTITASNGVGTATQAFTLIVNNLTSTPTFTSASSTTFTLNAAGTFTVTTSASPAVTAITRGGDPLPAGVGFVDHGDGTATLSGTATAGAGQHNLTFTATNGGTPVTQHFTLTIQQAAAITSGNAVTFLEETPGTFAVTATGLPIPVLTVTGTLPTDVTFVDHGDGTATLAGTPDDGSAGTYTLTISATNGVGAAFDQTFTLTVGDVNKAPSFTAGADQTLLEDAGSQTIAGWATAISAGPGETQTVTFEITNNTNAALFSAGPAVNGTNGDLTFTTATNANGLATITLRARDDGGTANGGVDVSPTQTFGITVAAVNDPPTFVKGADQTVPEDSPAQTVPNWATSISPGPPDESAQTVSFSVTGNTNPALFAVPPAVSPTGTLTYQLAPDAIGTATMTLTLTDNGGTANGGVNASSQTFVISTTDVNDAPSFTKGADQTVLEDAGAQTVAGWATAISAGPGEGSQTLTFVIVNNTNPGLFAAGAGPAVSPLTGDLTFTPEANAHGTATITIRLDDDGGTANGGVNQSATQTFDIIVTAVNDLPTFVKGPDVPRPEDSPAQTIPGWATMISPGPPDEAAQTVAFAVIGNDNSALFSVQPAVSPTGELTFTPAPNMSGTANITLRLDDSAGGQSLPQTFAIIITGVNDPPAIDLDADNSGGTTGADYAIAFTENNPAMLLEDPVDATLTDPDTGTTLLTLTVRLTNLLNPGLELLDVDLTGFTPAFSKTYDTTTTPGEGILTIAAAGPQPIADFELLLRRVIYQHTGENPNPLPRVVTFIAFDGTANSNTATSTVTITPVNDPPVANPDTFGPVAEGGTLNQPLPGVLVNDTDAELTALAVDTATVSVPANGSVVLNADGSFTYTHNGSETTSDSFTYRVTDGVNFSSTTTVTINITPVNEAPVAMPDSYTVNEGAATTVPGPAGPGVLANDIDPDSPLTATLISPPAQHVGTFTLNGDGSFIYAHNGSETITDSFTYQASDGVNPPSTATVTITITPVNDAPALDLDLDNDGGTPPTAGNDFAITFTDGDLPRFIQDEIDATITDADSPNLTSITVTLTNLLDPTFEILDVDLVAGGFAANFTKTYNTATPGVGVLTITASPSPRPIAEFRTLLRRVTYQNTDNAPDATATRIIEFVVNDGTGNGNTATTTVTVVAIDDPPTADNDSYSVNEGATLNVPAATGVLDGDVDPEGDTPITAVLVLGPSNATSFTLNSDGSFSYQHNGSETATDSFTYTANSPSGPSNVATVTITINPVNDPPTFTPGANQTVNEDAGAQSVSNFITGISAVEAGQTVSFNIVSNNNTALFSTQPAISGTGTLTYTPSGHAFGIATITYNAMDNGGTANGGQNTSTPNQTFTITVNPVNDAPVVNNETFDVVGNTEFRVDMPAGSGPHTTHSPTVSGRLGVLDNDADPIENDPLVVSAIANCVVADPTPPFDCTLTGGAVVHVEASGAFSYTPAPGATTGTLSYTVTDQPTVGTPANVPGTLTLNFLEMIWYVDGDAAAGGTGTSIAPFNNFGSLSGAGGVGDSDLAGHYIHVGTSTVTATLELEANQHLIGQGVALQVNQALNGVAAPNTVLAAGTAPTLTSGADTIRVIAAMPAEIRGLNIASTAGGGNAIDVTTSGPYSGSPTLTIANNTFTGTATGETIDVNGGATGTLGLTIGPNTWSGAHAGNGIDVRTAALSGTINLALTNNASIVTAGTAILVDGSLGGTVRITALSGINIAGTHGGTGVSINTATFDQTPGAPFDTVSAGAVIMGASGASNGVGASGILFTNVSGDLSFSDLDIFADNGTAFSVDGTNAAGVGVNTGTGTGTRVVVGGSPTLQSAGGPVVNISDTTITLPITSATVTSSPTTGISLSNVVDGSTNATFSVSSGAISGTTGSAFNVTGSNATVSYGGTIASTVGRSVNLQNNGNDTISFTNTISGTGNTGIFLDNNDQFTAAATMTFSGGVTLNGGNSTFTATNGGTLNVTGTNTIGATTPATATALNVSNTTIGVSDVTFRSISATGAPSGIVLNTTGASGGLTVTGDATTASNGSGGVIQNSTGPGISLASTRDVDLDQMNVINGGDDGIKGLSVTNFTLNRSNVTTNGNSTSDDGIQFGETSGSVVGVTGNVSILTSSISGNAHNNVHIRNTSGTIDTLTVTSSSFNNLNDTTGANSFLFEASGTSTITEAFMTSCTFSNNSPQRALEVQAHDTATISDFVVSGGTFTGNGIHASFTQDTSSNLEFYFVNNNVTTPNTADNVLQAVNVFSSSQATGGTIVARISGNTINTNQESISGIDGVIQGRTVATLLIDGNTVSGASPFGNRGISMAFRGPTAALGPATTHDITITNNNVDNVTGGGGFPLAAISVEADNQSGSFATAPTVRADIRGNTVPGAGICGDLTVGCLQFYEYDGDGTPGEFQDGIGQLVDTAPASANADAQLSSTNTGSVASFGISLIAGPINTPPPVPTPLLADVGDVDATTRHMALDTLAAVHDGVLSQAELDTVVRAAIARWSASGLSAEQRRTLATITFTVADMPRRYLASFAPGHVTVDADAAGRGWFVDQTPRDDVEFAILSGEERRADGTAAPAGRYDLLTAVMHEIGHALGERDRDAIEPTGDAMRRTLPVGVRRLPPLAVGQHPVPPATPPQR